MEIDNPQSFDHIECVSGQTIQPTFIAHAAIQIGKIADGILVWRTPDDATYMIPGAIMGTSYEINRVKIVDIGVWDMVATLSVNIAHGLAFATIRSVQAVIINDAGDMIHPLNTGAAVTNSTPQGFVYGWDATHVHLSELNGGFFDHVDFDDGVMNRGYIHIWYAE